MHKHMKTHIGNFIMNSHKELNHHEYHIDMFSRFLTKMAEYDHK